MTQAPPTPQPVDTAKKVRTILWILIAAVVAAGVIWFAVITATKPTPAVPAGGAQLVREDSHRITNPATEKAQLVEFLDFECESCRAAYPLVEELKNGIRGSDHVRPALLPPPGTPKLRNCGPGR